MGQLRKIAIPALILALILSLVFVAVPTNKAIAKHGGGPAANPSTGTPWNFPKPPGWSHPNGVVRYDGPGHWTKPPGWSHPNGVVRYDGPGHWITPPGWSHPNSVVRYDGPGHWTKPPGWSNA